MLHTRPWICVNTQDRGYICWVKFHMFCRLLFCTDLNESHINYPPRPNLILQKAEDRKMISRHVKREMWTRERFSKSDFAKKIGLEFIIAIFGLLPEQKFLRRIKWIPDKTAWVKVSQKGPEIFDFNYLK